jgi:predicted AAA+ superfamily ATPase
MLNFAEIAGDAGMSPSTVREHYFLLEDTLIGHLLPAWTKSVKRKAISTAKFYFFDTGVTHALAGTRFLDRNSDLYGRSVEHWIGLELRAYLDYRRRHDGLAYWRSIHQHEVDFIVGDHTAVDVKATRRVGPRDLRGLAVLGEERRFRTRLLVSEDQTEAVRDGVRCLPWRTFVDELWGDALF